MAGYSVVATYTPSRHRDGVTLFYLQSPHYAVEAVQHFGTNAVGFQMATGDQRWYIVGCYLAPNNPFIIESVVAALKERPRGAKLLVAGDLNVNLADPEGDWREE